MFNVYEYFLICCFRSEQKQEYSNLEECGITSRFNNLSLFLSNYNNNMIKKYIHMKVISRHNLPEEFKNERIENLPSGYKKPMYICPNSIQFDIYKSKEVLKEPIDEIDLVTNCENFERILMNMYPGIIVYNLFIFLFIEVFSLFNSFYKRCIIIIRR